MPARCSPWSEIGINTERIPSRIKSSTYIVMHAGQPSPGQNPRIRIRVRVKVMWSCIVVSPGGSCPGRLLSGGGGFVRDSYTHTSMFCIY